MYPRSRYFLVITYFEYFILWSYQFLNQMVFIKNRVHHTLNLKTQILHAIFVILTKTPNPELWKHSSIQLAKKKLRCLRKKSKHVNHSWNFLRNRKGLRHHPKDVNNIYRWINMYYMYKTLSNEFHTRIDVQDVKWKSDPLPW